jgi:MMP 1-O-methyltransferase
LTNVTRERVARIPSYLRALSSLVGPDLIEFLPVWLRVRRRVRGWLRMPDAMLLFRLARHGNGNGEVVEIGSAWGRSTIFLAAGTKVAGREPVTAIDPHTGDAWFLADEGVERIDSFTEFTKNIDDAGLSDWVKPLVMTSEQAAHGASAPIRLLFIDGLHTEEAVEGDIADWLPRVVAGGSIIFDDYDNVTEGVGVRAAVDRLLTSGLVEPQLRRAFNLVWTTKV